MDAAPRSLQTRQRLSGVGPMGVRPGVTSAREAAYFDNEIRVEYFDLAPGEGRTLYPGPLPRFGVLGRGILTVHNVVIVPGQILIVRDGYEALMTAGASGTTLFLADVDEDVPAGASVQLVEGDPLEPFEPEGIIVAAGTANRLGARFNLAEVIVPPGVRTSQHDLGVNERYLMLDGPATVRLDDRVFKVDAGDVVHIPSGTMQCLENTAAGPLRFYCLCTPPFTMDTYGAGPQKSRRPAEFDLAQWWQDHQRLFGGATSDYSGRRRI
jgi:mannose-6-phosphate isomerase-like protein (cupin superfamily)